MDRIWGAFYGQIVGDALGSRYEFEKSKIVKNRIKSDKKYGFLGLFQKPFLPMLGVGLGDFKPGQFTDDSEMALSLARSIVEKQKFDQIDVACSYAYWMETGPLTAGFATKNAFRNSMKTVTDNPLNPNWRTDLNDEQKQKVLDKILYNVRDYNGKSLSNGTLMRISPLAIAYRNSSPSELRKLATLDTQITHCHPTAADATSVYVIALASLLNGNSREEVYNLALEHAETELVKIHLNEAKKCPVPVKLPDNFKWQQPTVFEVLTSKDLHKPMEYTDGDDKAIGYTGVALQGAFYELLHAESFSSGLENVISRGGDTDTNGCIAASLLGAYFGVENIPEDWIESVRRAEPYLGCRDHERTKVPMDFLSLKDVDELIPKLANICS